MSDAIQFNGRVIRETEDAILFRHDDWDPDGSDDTWLPKSQIGIITDVGDQVLIDMPEWLAVKKDMY
jgi:hypothetical protein